MPSSPASFISFFLFFSGGFSKFLILGRATRWYSSQTAQYGILLIPSSSTRASVAKQRPGSYRPAGRVTGWLAAFYRGREPLLCAVNNSAGLVQLRTQLVYRKKIPFRIFHAQQLVVDLRLRWKSQAGRRLDEKRALVSVDFWRGGRPASCGFRLSGERFVQGHGPLPMRSVQRGGRRRGPDVGQPGHRSLLPHHLTQTIAQCQIWCCCAWGNGRRVRLTDSTPTLSFWPSTRYIVVLSGQLLALPRKYIRSAIFLKPKLKKGDGHSWRDRLLLPGNTDRTAVHSALLRTNGNNPTWWPSFSALLHFPNLYPALQLPSINY